MNSLFQSRARKEAVLERFDIPRRLPSPFRIFLLDTFAAGRCRSLFHADWIDLPENAKLACFSYDLA